MAAQRDLKEPSIMALIETHGSVNMTGVLISSAIVLGRPDYKEQSMFVRQQKILQLRGCQREKNWTSTHAVSVF